MKKIILTVLFIPLVLYSQEVFSSEIKGYYTKSNFTNNHVENIKNLQKIAIKYSSAMQNELQQFQRENSSRAYDYSNLNTPSYLKENENNENNIQSNRKKHINKMYTDKEENNNIPKWWRDESTTRWGLWD